MMKRIIVFVAILMAFSPLNAQTSETSITSKIKEVTVFQKNAQVVRKAKGTVPAGSSNLVFTGISPSINAQSVQFKAKGEFTILSVVHRLNYIAPKEVPAKIQKLNDQKLIFQDAFNIENAKMQALAEEEKMILANRAIGSQQSGVSVENLAATAKFYREHLFALKTEKLNVQKEINRINQEIQKIHQQINEINAQNPTKATSEIVVAVQADKNVTADFSLQYLVHNAGWRPAYDLKVKDVNSPVKMKYKAEVYQNSGEDWKSVNLSLATGNPALSGTKPNISTWWLREYVTRHYNKKRNDKLAEYSAQPEVYNAEDEIAEEAYDANYAAVDQVERTTFTEFAVKIPQTVSANGKPHVVNVADYELPADYVYYAAPKLDKNAFLTAKVTGWEAYNLLNGQASLFFEGTYLGKSYINVESSKDTLDLSLGRDAGIVIKRVKEKQFKDKQFIGKYATKTIAWNIELRNKKKQDVKIVIEDQIPVSTTDQIEVKLESSKGASLDEKTGMLRWELDLKPGKTKEIGFKYAVKYPKKMILQLE